jgi:hypothetical protein
MKNVKPTTRYLVALLLTASCGTKGGDVTTQNGGTDASASTTAATYACEPSATNCEPAEVLATVELLYVQAGATEAEARCLAGITAEDKTAVNQAFEAPTPSQEAAAVRCTGSAARLGEISSALAEQFSSMQP